MSIGAAITSAAGNAASGGMMDSIMKLMGPDSSLMKMLGSEGMANLIKGGTSLFNGMQMGDMLDFQKNLATKADQRTDTLFQQDQKDRQALNDLEFA
jgi:hypothetical protein